ncbi:hypothetical protein N7G274_010546 [Stereocaulon virgatum]|uniref:Secreted protein n=1 Tax=Stereocaulon virgatum TaxID=373712 RepID=A0ABR3ZVJ7_9LECA
MPFTHEPIALILILPVSSIVLLELAPITTRSHGARPRLTHMGRIPELCSQSSQHDLQSSRPSHEKCTIASKAATKAGKTAAPPGMRPLHLWKTIHTKSKVIMPWSR